jgi:hypothetical protein
MISLAEALYIAFQRQSAFTQEYVSNKTESFNGVVLDGCFDLEDIADELKDILLEE